MFPVMNSAIFTHHAGSGEVSSAAVNLPEAQDAAAHLQSFVLVYRAAHPLSKGTSDPFC